VRYCTKLSYIVYHRNLGMPIFGLPYWGACTPVKKRMASAGNSPIMLVDGWRPYGRERLVG
jgi:hypothetical protein